jgi:DNA-binding NarL/FixJ family response regulator
MIRPRDWHYRINIRPQEEAMPVKPTILIVEDHDAVRTSLRELLCATFPGCSFLEARTGEEALAMASAYPPHIVLMDLALPGMNGIEAVRHLKASAPDAQVVMLTIHEDAEYKLGASAAGASAYVTKGEMHSSLVPILTALLSMLETENDNP